MSEPTQDQTELEKLLRRTKPWFEQNGTMVIYGVAAALAIAAAVVYFNRKPAGDPQASRDLYEALLGTEDIQGGRPEGFRDFADAYPDSKLADWAKLKQAEALFDDAIGNMFANREVGIEVMQQSRTAFEQLSKKKGLPDEIQERVAIGIARVTESECDGTEASVKSAIDAWKQVALFDNGILTEHAEERIADLESPEAGDWYAWFHAQTPAEIDPGLAPGQPAVPALPGDEPEAGSLPVLSADDDNEDPAASEEANEVPAASEEANEVPAASEEAMDEPAPAETPGSESPADPAKETPDVKPEPAKPESPEGSDPKTEAPAAADPAPANAAPAKPATKEPAPADPAGEQPAAVEEPAAAEGDSK